MNLIAREREQSAGKAIKIAKMLLPSTTFVYRIGQSRWDFHHRKFIYSETYVSEDPEISNADCWSMGQSVSAWFNDPFGPDVGWPHAATAPGFIERLWPTQHMFTPSFLYNPIGAVPLNPAAPEAAVRLQRVGADGSLGRCAIPLWNDDFYLDLPHRRRIDADTLNEGLPDGLDSHPMTFTWSGRTIHNAIVHRSTGTWTDVINHFVLPSTVRIWARSRTYDAPAHVGHDRLRKMPELTWFT